MNTRSVEKIKEKLERELDNYADMRDLSPSAREDIHIITDTLKNFCKIKMLEENDGGYSSRGYWDARGSYGNSYNGGSSYDSDSSYRSRRGTHYVRGHYSREGAKDEMMTHLEKMMDIAESDSEREAIRRCMDSVKNA